MTASNLSIPIAALLFALLGALSSAALAGAGYTGSESCAQCHRAEYERWLGSHHDLAMQPAEERTVLGDFADATFEYNGVRSRFYRKGNGFFVHTDGPDGDMGDYEIRYAFGFTPLQQYLIELPGGRLQALGIAWDSRSEEAGGQRWFHLYPDEKLDYKHPLHWTRLSQTWNHQCAECHSTDLRKNYDRQSNTYKTSWEEIDVGCEACHGPGSAHQTWAEAGAASADNGLAITLTERRGVHWTMDPKTGNARRSKPREGATEIELCARCHSRRGLLSEDYRHGESLTRTHHPVFLSEGLYHADGQIDEEVYVYGSFLQSKMFQAGVTCSDCHDPHSNALRIPGNGACLSCHAANRFDTPEHHHHPAGSTGASCAECHMPTKDYMVVDPRHDHGFRIPRPDLSQQLGTPNACTGCHADKDDRWASLQMESWYGGGAKGYQNFALALKVGREDGRNASALLNRLARNKGQPAIARASAISLLARYFNRETFATLQQALESTEPLIRLAAAGSLEGQAGELRAALLSPLLSDPQRAVRIEAARVLADAPRDLLDGQALDAAMKEYVDSQLLNADRPEALLNLGNLARRQGQMEQAQRYMQQAVALERDFAPAFVNLADLYRAWGKTRESLEILQQGLKVAPDDADLLHALGLAQVRSGEKAAALTSLAQAAELAPSDPRYAFVHAIALNGMGQSDEAIRVLDASLRGNPTHRDTLFTLVQLNLEAGNSSRAELFARRFRQLWPGDARSRQLESLAGGKDE